MRLRRGRHYYYVNNEIAIINDYQKKQYEDYEKGTANILLDKYKAILDKTVQDKNKIKILDIGGASGNFALVLYNYLHGKNCEIMVIDTTEYDTWDKFQDKIKFIRESANNLENMFSANTFDIVFANRVFHHFVIDSWKKSVELINNVIRQISIILKDDGYFCITDYFYDGLFFDTSASRMIYTLTSCKIPLFVRIFRRIEAKSAGIGVCFLSRKMWYKIFVKNNLYTESINEGHKLKRNILRIITYKVCLFIKNVQENVIILRKCN